MKIFDTPNFVYSSKSIEYGSLSLSLSDVVVDLFGFLIVCEIAASECDVSQVLRHSFFPIFTFNAKRNDHKIMKKKIILEFTEKRIRMHIAHKPASTRISIIHTQKI